MEDLKPNNAKHRLWWIFNAKMKNCIFNARLFKEIFRKSFLNRSQNLSTSLIRRTGDYEYEDPKSEEEVVNITYITRDGTAKKVRGKVDDNVMYLAHRYNIEIEGACEASLACCTCHVYVDEKYYEKLPKPVEDEEDMLDMAPLLKPNSRLSCQIILNKELDGLVVALPKITRNFYIDGHVPEPH